MKTFAQALCEHAGCSPEKYLRVALKHCLYPRARAFSWLFAGFASLESIRLLEAVGKTTSEKRVRELLHEYWDSVHLRGGILERRCKLRVSGKRLLKLFRHVMRENTEPPES